MKFIKVAVLLIGILRADNSAFRADLSLVRIDARVTTAGALLNGLDASSFRIEDEGIVQPIVQCSLDQQKLDVVLLFDVSSSMGPSIRQVALTADRALRELYPGDRVAVMTFNIRARVKIPFSEDLTTIGTAIKLLMNRTAFEGGTYILEAVQQAAKYIKKYSEPERRRTILIFTDNDGYGSDIQEAVIRSLRQVDTSLNGIVLATAETIAIRLGVHGANRMNSPDDINPIAEQTGGNIVNGTALATSFEDLIQRIRRTYSLYYKLPADAKPGQLRHVRVDLNPEVRYHVLNAQVVSRSSYVVPRGIR